MTHPWFVLALFTALVLGSPFVHAEEGAHAEEAQQAQQAQEEPGAEKSAGETACISQRLPPELRVLLIREMHAVLDSSEALVGAIALGRHQEVAATAQAIQETFVLEQDLGPQQRQTLEESVPAGFLEMDRAFHETSGLLAEAAIAQDGEREVEVFTDMVGLCVACHRRYAGDRFPGFASDCEGDRAAQATSADDAVE